MVDCGQYDISPEQRRLLEEKNRRRNALRQEYLRQINDPHRHATGEGGTVFDSGVQRFMSMKTCGYDTFKPTPKSGLTAIGFVIGPIVLFAWLLKTSRDAKEHQYRTGQVSYAERRFKFI